VAMAASPSLGPHFDDSMLGLASGNTGPEDEAAKFTTVLAVALDGPSTWGPVLEALKLAIKYRKASRRSKSIAVAILSMDDLEVIKEAVGGVGINLSDINYVVANAGAELWTVTADGEDEVNIESLDEYDEHIFFRWDSANVQRTLMRVSQSRVDGHGMLHPLVQDADKNYPVHPFHLCLSVPATGQRPVLLKQQIKRRLRQNGIRCQMSVLAGPDMPRECYAGTVPEGDVGMLHVTPLRASRSLGLRWLGTYLGIPMSKCALVCAGTKDPGTGELMSLASDLPDLAGGSQRALIVAARDGNAVCGDQDLVAGRLEKSVLAEFGNRVVYSTDPDSLQQWVSSL